MQINNRKAKFNYDITDEYIGGIVLLGSEIKSLRQGKCNISDAYCVIHNGEAWLKNCYISKYDSDKFTNHDELRDRKLLLTKKEIRKIKEEIQTPGITIAPLSIFINNRGLAKVKIGIARGKKNYDKRNDIKDRDNERELDRIIKNY